MKKLRVFESISVDGYFTDADGEVGWAHAARQDPEFVGWVSRNANSGGELVFGRKTSRLVPSNPAGRTPSC
jgi:dihydrofolate reductase